MNESRRFEGKVALITGAASGIGRAVALRLAAEGAQVFGHDLNADGLAETAALVAAAGGTMETRAGDISQAAECRRHGRRVRGVVRPARRAGQQRRHRAGRSRHGRHRRAVPAR